MGRQRAGGPIQPHAGRPGAAGKDAGAGQGMGRPGNFLQPLAGHAAGAVGQPGERHRGIFVDAVSALGRGGVTIAGK